MTFPSKVMAWLKDLSIYQYLIKKHITGLFQGLNEGHFTGLATFQASELSLVNNKLTEFAKIHNFCQF